MDSKLQIISGKFRGKKLDWPKGARPTSMRAKVALFNILMPIVKAKNLDNGRDSPAKPWNDMIIWDVYAGSGAFGAEFVSRGVAKTAIFTDSDPEAIKIISNNLKDMRQSSSIIIERAEMPGIAKKYAPKADLIFLDPPYNDANSLKDTLSLMSKLMKNDAILVLEFESAAPTGKDEVPGQARDDNGLEVLTQRKYGRAGFVIFRKK